MVEEAVSGLPPEALPAKVVLAYLGEELEVNRVQEMETLVEIMAAAVLVLVLTLVLVLVLVAL
jgi:hypothetical protein